MDSIDEKIIQAKIGKELKMMMAQLLYPGFDTDDGVNGYVYAKPETLRDSGAMAGSVLSSIQPTGEEKE